MEIDKAALSRLGKNIRMLRIQRDLTQKQLSQLCKIDGSFLSQIERAKRNISFKILHKIASALDLTVSELTQGL